MFPTMLSASGPDLMGSFNEKNLEDKLESNMTMQTYPRNIKNCTLFQMSVRIKRQKVVGTTPAFSVRSSPIV